MSDASDSAEWYVRNYNKSNREITELEKQLAAALTSLE